jgi:hypothetical protein
MVFPLDWSLAMAEHPAASGPGEEIDRGKHGLKGRESVSVIGHKM